MNKKLVIFDFDGVLVNTTVDTKTLYELVHKLSASYVLTVVSSAHSDQITSFLIQEGIVECFQEILGVDSEVSKEKKITNLLKRNKTKPENAVYVTDTVSDIRDAAQCNVASIGVTWGTQNEDTLFEGAPYAIVDTVPLLESAIEEVLANS